MKNARRLPLTLVLLVLSSLALAEESDLSRREALRAALDRANSNGGQEKRSREEDEPAVAGGIEK